MHKNKYYKSNVDKDTRYYYIVNSQNICQNVCHVIDDGMYIGSVGCESCQYHLEKSLIDRWIRCSKLSEAIGE